ncbi:MAG: dephospho-CoA kinase [Succinivibrio sp.]
MRVGITGGIACGKSGISSLFAKLGVPIVDTDIVAREVVRPGMQALRLLTEAFGEQILLEDGSLNRKRLREIVFNGEIANALDTLNGIMAPAIQKETLRQVDECQAPYVLIIIPLLFEHHLESLVDRILVIDTTPEIQLKRLMRRDGIDEKLAISMIRSQVDRETRIKKADDLIESDESSLDKKANLVLKLHNLYQQISDFNK